MFIIYILFVSVCVLINNSFRVCSVNAQDPDDEELEARAEEHEGLAVHGDLLDVLGQGVVLGKAPQGLKEEQTEHGPREDHHEVGGHVPKHQLGTNYNAENNKFVASISEHFKKQRIANVENIEESLKHCSLQHPYKH